jgi:hypothetical protein
MASLKTLVRTGHKLLTPHIHAAGFSGRRSAVIVAPGLSNAQHIASRHDDINGKAADGVQS